VLEPISCPATSHPAVCASTPPTTGAHAGTSMLKARRSSAIGKAPSPPSGVASFLQG
jgi:hypothetical protein